MHDYICSWGKKLSVDGKKQTCGKGKTIVRLYARSLYSASARVMYGIPLSFTFCSVSFKVSRLCTIFFQCIVAWTDHRLYPVSISGCDYKCWDCRFSVQVYLHHSSSATWLAQNSNKHHALRVKLDVDPISGMKQESWFNIIYPVGTSRVLWVRLTHTPLVSWWNVWFAIPRNHPSGLNWAKFLGFDVQHLILGI